MEASPMIGLAIRLKFAYSGLPALIRRKNLALSYFSRIEYFANFENSPLKQENVFW